MNAIAGVRQKKHKYHRIADEIKKRILNGEYQPGDRLPSYTVMRAAYQATQGSIDKALSVLEAEHLITRKPNSGIYVAAFPQQKGALRGTIGLVVPRFDFPKQSPYWLYLLHSVHEAAQRHEAQVLLLGMETLKGWEKADGVLLCQWGLESIWQKVPPQMPSVSLLEAAPGRAAVVADDYAGGRLATEHLLQLGHHRIAYLHNIHQLIVSRRRDGYRDALLKAGVEPDPTWERTLSGHVWLDDSFSESGYQTMRDWIRGNWSTLDCTALLAHNDEVALGAIRALEEAGVRVPDDVSVVGFDGIQRAAHGQPQLTTIEVPLQQIGTIALELLLQQIHKNQALADEQRVLPVRLRVGKTTASPRI